MSLWFPSRAVRSVVAALAVLSVLVPAAVSHADSDSADAPAEGWVWVGDDVVVRGEPEAGSSLRSASTSSGLGFAVLGPVKWNLPSVRFRLVSSSGIETVRPQAESVAAELTSLTGGSFVVPPGTTTGTSPDYGEILVVVSSTSPCGSGGWIGCGGPQWVSDTVVAGQVWIHPDAVAGSATLLHHVVAHELGHALGLSHFDTTFLGQLQVMRSVVETPYPTFHQGDVNGFRSLHCREDEFTDVDRSSPFCSEITWATTQDMAEGYSDGSFGTTRTVRRQEMAALLYRLAGSPDGADPGCLTDPFTDVGTSNPFCGEIRWLDSTGITTGYPDGTFRPLAPVSRREMAAFLYRLAGSSNGANPGCTTAPFTDVGTSNPFCGEIRWLDSTGITTGYSDGTFRPHRSVLRQEMVAFLFRKDALAVPTAV